MPAFYNGCGKYWRLISDGLAQRGLLELQKKFHEATQHRETCPECIAINTPLAEHLFKQKVKVVDVDRL